MAYQNYRNPQSPISLSNSIQLEHQIDIVHIKRTSKSYICPQLAYHKYYYFHYKYGT